MLFRSLWRFDTRRGGTGALGDIGSHFLYIARLLFGEIVQVRAQLDRLVNRPNLDPDGMEYPKADDTALICLKFENGAQGVVHASTLAYEPTPFSQIHQMEFHGTSVFFAYLLLISTVTRFGAKSSIEISTLSVPLMMK